ncbi:DEAD/DEAH box helicase [Planctobacterium marinum]|uniref:DEAD/DEAH box helicase n=1 Tax=Planctobacterium marinum TaxID=1631968 RepID=UPI001E4F36C2|nr:DEAD/DEAH box helicase [Planctobacterium marinum]MCC2604913.1 DEAD/DEAH box helicase [Planctobacterium marinum]
MTSNTIKFSDLNLPQQVLDALDKIGYETPSPIQAEAIPLLSEGHDLIGQAQTGTGKTAAFALPMLAKVNPEINQPQLVVLAPTRELAIQVAEAFQAYAAFSDRIRILPIYGGSSYDHQIRQLKRGVQIVVGTPGRVIDHIKRKTLRLDNVSMLVLDEADEMLRMGFIDDVEWVLEQVPADRQTALFSATMPPQIRKIADKFLDDPKTVKIAAKTSTAEKIRQRFCKVSPNNKLEALTRVLEVEEFDGVIIFVRTKTATTELADKLAARGYDVEPLNGDIQQKSRERTVERLKQGQIDILVATDVVARGLDVDRVSHVINFDIPYDTESYVHRIGRTGRAGREGEAILFISPREMRMLKAIEKATKQAIAPLPIPNVSELNESRLSRFKTRVFEALDAEDLETWSEVIAQIQQETEAGPKALLAAFASLAQGGEQIFLSEDDVPEINLPDRGARDNRRERGRDGGSRERGERGGRERSRNKRDNKPDENMQRYKIMVGRKHDVRPGSIVGAIANEAGLDSEFIGAINIYDNFSTVDLPKGMPNEVRGILKKTRVAGQKLDLTEWQDRPEKKSRPRNNRD